MTITQMLAFNQMRKSAGVAYLLFIFLGGLGIHRFYLRQVWPGVVWMGVTVLTLQNPGMMIPFAVVALIELCVLHMSVKAYNNNVLLQIRGTDE